MKQIAALTIALSLAVIPANAQDIDPPSDTDEGFSLMQEGARLLMQGLMDELEPTMDELREGLAEMGPAFAEFAATMGPAFADLLNQVDDLRNYAAPEFLPNGDIIIRRDPDAPAWQPDPDSGEIEL